MMSNVVEKSAKRFARCLPSPFPGSLGQSLTAPGVYWQRTVER
jgi:hypothetical protein